MMLVCTVHDSQSITRETKVCISILYPLPPRESRCLLEDMAEQWEFLKQPLKCDLHIGEFVKVFLQVIIQLSIHRYNFRRTKSDHCLFFHGILLDPTRKSH
jgi:hypothetical protein